MDGFTTPPKHIGFLAKKLFGCAGVLKDGAIAYMEKGGGGPTEPHSHDHDHLFIVVKGEARVEFDDETVLIAENESYLVKGKRRHSVWNNSDGETVVIGLTVDGGDC